MRGATAAIVALLAVLTGLPVTGQEKAREGRVAVLDALVEAERAFARLSGRIGQVPAFLAYFADDVVTFRPAPATGKEALRALAGSAAVPPARHLDWEPWFADVADAADLGYTTGPTMVTEVATGKTLRTGWYFSVWKHDANGWRVAADIGIEAPPAGALRPRPVTAGVAATSFARPGRAREELLGVEREMAERAGSAGLADAYGRYLGASARIYRDGNSPMVGAAAIAAFLAASPAPGGWRVLDAGVSASGDLAFTYGLYGVAPAQDASAAKGSFLHVWKPGPSGWTLAAEVVNLAK